MVILMNKKPIFNTKAQAAAGAAVLVAIIAGLLIMFIVLAPPEERAKLLGETYTSTGTGTSSSSGVVTNFLQVSPGKVDYFPKDKIEHPLPIINIQTKVESKVLAEKNMAYSKKAAFTEETSNFKFSIDNLDNIDNVFLNFRVKALQGRLIVTLNGDKIYNSEAPENQDLILSLPKTSLKEMNEVIFSVSSSGLAFWSTNEASLEEIQVVGDIVNKEAQSAKSIFIISKTEKDNLEKVTLKFKPDCIYGQAGKLAISINGDEIYNALPDCDLSIVPLEFSSDKISVGENEINFKTEKGTYILSNLIIASKLKDMDFPTYYFDLSNERYEEIKAGKYKLRVKLDFVDTTEWKNGELIFNGHTNQFETKKINALWDLSEDIVQGSNSIKIKPKKTLEIRELRADLIE